MTTLLSKLKITARRVLIITLLAAGSLTLMGSASGCKLPGSGGGGWIPGLGAKKEYTILLHTFIGPEHVRQSKLYRDKTKKAAGWSGLEVVHKNSNSELYWGKYVSIPAAEVDLKKARSWRAPNVNQVAFPFPKVVLIPGKDVGNPEYNLLNVSEGYWTVLVAIFVDVPSKGSVGRERQENALTYCKFLRDKGYEAYYHHTPGRSQITVGKFP
jgi:hypothetical protein